jgi:dTDP-4-dehydrorhamnose 3,5-epimerase
LNTNYEQLKISPYEDYRGQLKKIAKKSMLNEGQEIQEIYVLYSNKGTVRGNHYHELTTELFTVVSGEAKMAFAEINKNNTEIITIKASDNITIKVHPNIVHAFKNELEEPLIILAVSLKEYNPQDTDTFPYIILE